MDIHEQIDDLDQQSNLFFGIHINDRSYIYISTSNTYLAHFLFLLSQQDFISKIFSEIMLEQRQYKIDSIKSKIIPVLKLPCFFSHRKGGEKARQFQYWNFLFEWSRFNIFLTKI